IVLVVLRFDDRRPRVVVLHILSRPPIPEIAFGIELSALIVEPVRQLMADDAANSAVVGRIVGLRADEGGLQNARGKDYLVEVRIVVGVNGGRAFYGPPSSTRRPT